MSDNRKVNLSPSEVKLIDHAVEIRRLDVFERDELGFAARMFVQCCLPHRDPGDDLPEWIRSNGNLSLTITPVKYMKDGKKISSGYPYGNIPRLLLFYICSQAVQTKKRDISLDESLAAFMRRVDLEVTGGKNGTIGRLKDQLNRLLRANIDFTYDDEQRLVGKKANIAHTLILWKELPENCDGFLKYKAHSDSCLVLTEEFYNEIMSYAIPVDMGIVSAIKQSPLALDLYSWLTYRVTSIYKPTRISWKSLAQQLGAEYNDLRDFGKYVKISLHKIFILWPELKVDEVKGGIILKPSKPSVPLKPFYFTNNQK